MGVDPRGGGGGRMGGGGGVNELPAISKHLKVLERAGLIARGRTRSGARAGSRRSRLPSAIAGSSTYRQHWEAAFDRLDARARGDEGGRRRKPARGEAILRHERHHRRRPSNAKSWSRAPSTPRRLGVRRAHQAGVGQALVWARSTSARATTAPAARGAMSRNCERQDGRHSSASTGMARRIGSCAPSDGTTGIRRASGASRPRWSSSNGITTTMTSAWCFLRRRFATWC